MSEELWIGDLVVYRNRTSLTRADLIGLVIGSSPEGRAVVLWEDPRGAMSISAHQDAALRLLERSSRTPT